MTKKDIKILTEILSKLNDSQNYIMREEISIMKQTNLSSTDIFTSAYYPNEKFCKINKEIGSMFCLGMTGTKNLQSFIEEKMKKNIKIK
jgi:hypothetical protein